MCIDINAPPGGIEFARANAAGSIIERAVNPDHVHLFIKYPPKYSVSFIAKRIKGRSSRILKQEFPELKVWCKRSLWAPSCYHGSVDHGWEVVENYIAGQDKKSKG